MSGLLAAANRRNQGFVPTNLGGCQIWQPPSAAGTGTAPTWANSGIAGTGFNAVELTNPPTGVAAVLNGQSIVRFNNGVERLVIPNFDSLFSTGATAFYVVKSSMHDSSWFCTGGSGNHADLYISGAGESYLTTFQASGRQLVYDHPPQDMWAIYMVRAGSVFTRYINGGTAPSAPSITFGFQSTSLFLGYNGGFPGACDMGEVIVYDSVLSDVAANQVGNYIAGWSALPWTNL